MLNYTNKLFYYYKKEYNKFSIKFKLQYLIFILHNFYQIDKIKEYKFSYIIIIFNKNFIFKI